MLIFQQISLMRKKKSKVLILWQKNLIRKNPEIPDQGEDNKGNGNESDNNFTENNAQSKPEVIKPNIVKPLKIKETDK